MSSMLADEVLVKMNGTSISGAEALAGKPIVGLYFAAYNDNACHEFTPLLKNFYEAVERSGDFEVVVVTADQSVEEFAQDIAATHGDWYHLAYGDSTIGDLKSIYDVGGIPALVIIRPNGDLITQEGCLDIVTKSPNEVLHGWKQA